MNNSFYANNLMTPDENDDLSMFHFDDKIIQNIPAFKKEIINKDLSEEELTFILKMDRINYCRIIFSTDVALSLALNEIRQFQIKDMALISAEEKLKYVERIIYLYRQTCLFPNSEVLDFFKRVGLQDTALNWLIDRNILIKEINRIMEGNNVVILPGMALAFIVLYLHYRIINEVLLWSGAYLDSYDGIKYPNILYIYGKNHFRYKEILDFNFLDINNILEVFDLLFTNVKYKKMALSHLKGDTLHIYLQAFISICREVTDVKSESKFLAEFYDLIRLLIGNPGPFIPHPALFTEEEFKIHYPKASYERYIGKRMKDIFYKENRIKVKQH